tara:strand:- start:972 stop:1172 length:201 start_codon:yes stop_codon:yes gene_type:complete
MSKTNTKLTSVKILKILYERFKISTVNSDMTLQKLTNRAIDLYLESDEFKKEVEIHDDLTVSGSNF